MYASTGRKFKIVIFASMKHIVLSIFATFLVLFTTAAQDLPSVNVLDADGKSVAVRSLADGKTPFILTMWATFCKPCMKELETLTDEAVEWREAFPLRIYAVSVDDSRSYRRAVAMAAGSGWEGIVPLFDVNGDLCRALNVSAVPHAFVFDANGKQIYTHIGFRPGDEAELLSKLKAAAGK